MSHWSKNIIYENNKNNNNVTLCSVFACFLCPPYPLSLSPFLTSILNVLSLPILFFFFLFISPPSRRKLFFSRWLSNYFHFRVLLLLFIPMPPVFLQSKTITRRNHKHNKFKLLLFPLPFFLKKKNSISILWRKKSFLHFLLDSSASLDCFNWKSDIFLVE